MDLKITLFWVKLCGRTEWKTYILQRYRKIPFFPDCLPYQSDILYKVLHCAIKVNHYTYKCSREKMNLSPNCNYYKQIEDILHYQPYFQKLKSKQLTPHQHITQFKQ